MQDETGRWDARWEPSYGRCARVRPCTMKPQSSLTHLVLAASTRVQAHILYNIRTSASVESNREDSDVGRSPMVNHAVLLLRNTGIPAPTRVLRYWISKRETRGRK